MVWLRMLINVGIILCSILAYVYGLLMIVFSISVMIELTRGSVFSFQHCNILSYCAIKKKKKEKIAKNGLPLVFLMNRAIARGDTLDSIDSTNFSSTDSTVTNVSMVNVPIWLPEFCTIIWMRPSVIWPKWGSRICCWFSAVNSSAKLKRKRNYE